MRSISGPASRQLLTLEVQAQDLSSSPHTARDEVLPASLPPGGPPLRSWCAASWRRSRSNPGPQAVQQTDIFVGMPAAHATAGRRLQQASAPAGCLSVYEVAQARGLTDLVEAFNLDDLERA